MTRTELDLKMTLSWDGIERRSGCDRRKGDRRRENTMNIGLIVAGEASRRTGADRRKMERRGADDPPDSDEGTHILHRYSFTC